MTRQARTQAHNTDATTLTHIRTRVEALLADTANALIGRRVLPGGTLDPTAPITNPTLEDVLEDLVAALETIEERLLTLNEVTQ